MLSKTVQGLTLYYAAEDAEAADLIRDACERTITIDRGLWGLGVPDDCRVYVMTSWLHFAFHAAPWPWRVFMALTLPLWGMQVRKTWPYAGGWVQQFGRRRAVGIKPPRLITAGYGEIGDRIFVPVEDSDEKTCHVACHELTHGFASHLKLPSWLYEGIAMVTVDQYVGAPTVRPDTIAALADSSREKSPERGGRLRVDDKEAFAYHYVRGYWLTRYLKDTRLDLLQNLLKERQAHEALERTLAESFGLDRDTFWQEIDGIVAEHYAPEDKGQQVQMASS
jgi:hypothetical protein